MHSQQPPAPMDHDIEQLLRQRRSARAFDGQPIPRAVMLRLIEAARWSASCANEQPWRFVIAERDDAEAFENVLRCLMEGNRRWAVRAGVLLVIAAKLTFERNGAANRYAHHDAGMALANLLLQATALGLAARPMGGFDVEATRAACRVPAGFDPVSVTALGYPASPDLLDADLRARELATRERLPIHQLVFAGTWGQEL